MPAPRTPGRLQPCLVVPAEAGRQPALLPAATPARQQIHPRTLLPGRATTPRETEMIDAEFYKLLAAAKQEAAHLELRDEYTIADEMHGFCAWKNGSRIEWADRDSWETPFHRCIADAVRRGLAVRRARVVSEPPTEYIQYEHYLTTGNIAAGEDVRWLPRRYSTDLLLPGNDFWLFDGQYLLVNHFSGDGRLLEMQIDERPDVIETCDAAFRAVWERAIPHHSYILPTR